MTRVPEVSILVVSYNTKAETLAALRSVYEQTREVTFELILVDNASADGSAAAVRAEFPGVLLVESEVNLGFSGANNRAGRLARGKYLLLLNPDTVVLDGAIDRILRFARAYPMARIYGGRTLFADGTLNRNSCHGRPTPWSLLCMGLGLSSAFRGSGLLDSESLGRWARDSVRPVDCVSGCFLLIERALWQSLDGFDPAFFMYGEDTDLCIRAKHYGAECLICPEASLIHHGGRSEKVRADKMIRLFRAKRQLIVKHWPPPLHPFGGAMLQCWALSRWCVTAAFALFHARHSLNAQQWREVFNRRREFLTCQRGTTFVADSTVTHP